LAKLGAHIDAVETYRNIVPPDAATRARKVFGDERKPDWITFTSSSTVSNFARLAGELNVSELLRGVAIASIGPITPATVKNIGLEVTIEAKASTVAALVRAIEEYCLNPAK